MTNTEALNILANIAATGPLAYHAGYARTVEYAKECKAYFGGVGIKPYLKPFARRESEELFKQREELTAHVQASLGNMLDKPFAKIERSNWTKVVTVGGDKDGQRAKAFDRETLSKFGTAGLFPYTFERLRYWNKYDPNCFVVVEFAPFDNQRTTAKPYPFEVTADMAVDFKYQQGDLDYLAVRQVQKKKDGDVMTDVERLTLYRPLQTVVLQQLTKTEIRTAGPLPQKKTMFEGDVINGQLLYIDADKVYRAIIPLPHDYPKTPAVRAGYIDSPTDDGKTKMSIFDSAMPFAKKLLKVNSEIDLVMALLAFPVSIRHHEVCTETGCNGGILADNTTCMVCHGTGYKPRPTSAQEEIVLPLPDRNEDMLDVSKILTYTYPPTDGIRLQIEVFEKWMDRAFKAVFSSEMYQRAEVAQTAMFHGVQLQSIYDTLYPYGRHISQVCAYLAGAIGYFSNVKPDAMAMPVIPSDLRFETVGDLFVELKSLRDAGGNNDAAALLQGRIMERLLRDDPESLLRWRIDDYFNPFRGMSEDQILEAMNSSLVPERKKAFYVNRGDIMAEILDEKPDFYRMARSMQRTLIEGKVDVIMETLNNEKPVLNLPGIAGNAVISGQNN